MKDMREKETIERYVELCQEIQDALENKGMDVIIPALAFFLSCAGKFNKMTEKELMDYSYLTIKTVYADQEITDISNTKLH